jgi:hypothetical protein
VAMLTPVIALALTVAPPPFRCPAGARLKTFDEESQLTRQCERAMANGQIVVDGPFLVWEKRGKRRQEGQFKEGRRAGTWTYWRPDGTRELVVIFGDQDDTRQLVSDPDQPWRRVQDFGPDRLTSRINGERITALGETLHQAARFRAAPRTAVARVVALYNAVGVEREETCCLFEHAKAADARKHSVARYMLEVLEPSIPQVARVCATLEVRVDFKVGDVVFLALEPSGEAKTECGGGLKADAFVAAMSYRQENPALARHNLERVLGQ